jgi:hypothetical protein
MKALHLVYDVEIEPLIHGILHRGMVIPRYTRFNDITGARAIELEAHTDYTMHETNRMVLVMAPEPVMDKLVADLRVLRGRLKHGLRGYVTSAEQFI